MTTLSPKRQEREVIIDRLALEHKMLSLELENARGSRQQEIIYELRKNEGALYALLGGSRE